MQVPYEVKKGIHGLGIFATESISAGTMTWKAIPGVNLEIFKTEVELRTHLEKLSFCSAKRLLEIAYGDPSLCVNGIIVPTDDSQYTNHAYLPNCGPHESCRGLEFNPTWMDSSISSHVYALRNIAAGEELTEDYRSFHLPFWYLHMMKEEYHIDTSYFKPTPFVLPSNFFRTAPKAQALLLETLSPQAESK
jgi:SET domain-containing protein